MQPLAGSQRIKEAIVSLKTDFLPKPRHCCMLRGKTPASGTAANPGTAVFSSEQALTALRDISRVARETVVNDATPKATSVVSVAEG
jgi:hypothetical protein